MVPKHLMEDRDQALCVAGFMWNEKGGEIFPKSQTELNSNKALIVNQFESK